MKLRWVVGEMSSVNSLDKVRYNAGSRNAVEHESCLGEPQEAAQVLVFFADSDPETFNETDQW